MPVKDASDAEVLWQNDPILLFHGTTSTSAEHILKSGVDIGRCKPRRDFGRGFYTTTSRLQARDFAIKRAVAEREDAAVIQLSIDRGRLSKLAALAFVRGDKDAHDYWSFVLNCRNGRPHRSEGSEYYDVVYGPVAVNWNNPMLRYVITNFDQVSFHTHEARLLLNESPKEVVW